MYSASKGALDAMIRSITLEVAGNEIRINNVNPGIRRSAELRFSARTQKRYNFMP